MLVYRSVSCQKDLYQNSWQLRNKKICRCLQPKTSTNGSPFGVRDFGLEVFSKGKRIAKRKESRVWLSAYIYIYTHINMQGPMYWCDSYERSGCSRIASGCEFGTDMYIYIYIYIVDSWLAKKNNEKIQTLLNLDLKKKILSKGLPPRLELTV